MRGFPGDIGGNSMSIPPEICPGVGDFPRFSVTILIAPRHSSGSTHTPGTFRTLASLIIHEWLSNSNFCPSGRGNSSQNLSQGR